MAPIRIGIIGLNAKSSWAVNAHLPYLRDTSKYTITALLNSSIDKARESIIAHNLPDPVAAYSSPEDLANDPNVDLVVCSVRVDRHSETLLPSAKAGKDIYCEWPLGKNLKEAEELAKIAKEKGARTMIGTQVVTSPAVNKVKQLVESGTIGKVLSTSIVGPAYNGGTQEWEGVEYITGREVGGNLLTIHFMHSLCGLLYALGEIASYSSIIETKRPVVEITDQPITSADRKVLRTVERTSPDHFLLQGHLSSGALFSYYLRGGKAFSPDDSLVWRIYGEKGEIQLTAAGAMLQIGYENEKLELVLGEGEKQVVEVPKDGWEKLPMPAQNVARLYEAFADGRTEEYCDWETAVTRHKLVEELYEREKSHNQETEARYLSEVKRT